MSRRASCQPWAGIGVLRGSLLTLNGLQAAVVLSGLCLVLWGPASSASGAVSGRLLTPPARPRVAPIVRGLYVGDTDRNRIDDGLEDRVAASTPGGLGSASADAPNEKIGVELIFSVPVTQDHIDAFLGLGGEITYMYRAVSYGWNGRIDRARVARLPAVMGPALVQVTGLPRVQWYMDLASQTGRVRPVWRPGFAGSADGFDGDPNTTIAFIDTGIDGEHPDLAGRCAYWNDLSDSADPAPIDRHGHGSLVAGVAVATGQSAGNADTRLTWTFAYDRPTYGRIADPITLPTGHFKLTSAAFWSGAPAWLDHVVWEQGSAPDSGTYVGRYTLGWSPLYLTNIFDSYGSSCYSTILVDVVGVPLRDMAVINALTPYPCVGDGFNTFSGVAPQCNWAAVRIPYETYDENKIENGFAVGLDDLVANRLDKKIKIINISGGLVDEHGLAKESLPFRDKINSAVRNGVIVVVAAGNTGEGVSPADRVCGDPERAALAICVGASNDQNTLTTYSSGGFLDPQAEAGEDFKPDLIAPGGSRYHSAMMSVDTGAADGAGVDQEPNDYACAIGTSLSSPYVAGCAALVIEAMQRNGLEWDFHSDEHPRFVKMVLCATASETNARRESRILDPTLERSAAGPEGFPAGKDRYEGYGLINADAAVEAVSLTYVAGTPVRDEFADRAVNRRVWARTMHLTEGRDVDLFLDNPAIGDFDLYLYSATPSDTGTPVILASSTAEQGGADESIHLTPETDMTVLVVVKRVSGSGAFELTSFEAGPPLALDVAATGWVDAPLTVVLDAVDDGLPAPPGQLSYTIASLPAHGRLESGSAQRRPITAVPAPLDAGANEVVYVPDANWVGDDSFTYYASDGGAAPLGGPSNTAHVRLTIVAEMTVSYQVAAGEDDADAMRWGTMQTVDGASLSFGASVAGMRFGNVDIPPAARILSAVLTVRSGGSYSSGWVAWRPPVYAEATDNAPAFSDTSRRVNNLTQTVNRAIWDLSRVAWDRDTWYDSPDISHVIQEVIDRPGWSAGNALVVVCGVDPGVSASRKIWSYEGDAASAAKLQITYGP